MSKTSTSTPFSIAGVGWRVFPYRLYTGKPVIGSRPDPTLAPACCAPRIPCSGPNSATRCTPGVCANRSTSLTSSRLTPVGLVIRPTFLPWTRSSRSCSSTSIPVWKSAAECLSAVVCAAANDTEHANSASSTTIDRQARSIVTLLPLVVGDLRLHRLAAGADLEVVYVPAAAVDLVVGPVAELDVMRVRGQCHGFRLPAFARTRQQPEYLPVNAVRRCIDAAVIIARLQSIPGLERQCGVMVRFDFGDQGPVQIIAITREPCRAAIGRDNRNGVRDIGIDVVQGGDGRRAVAVRMHPVGQHDRDDVVAGVDGQRRTGEALVAGRVRSRQCALIP